MVYSGGASRGLVENTPYFAKDCVADSLGRNYAQPQGGCGSFSSEVFRVQIAHIRARYPASMLVGPRPHSLARIRAC